MKLYVEYKISWRRGALRIIISSPYKKFKYWRDDFLGDKEWGFNFAYMTVSKYNFPK